MAKHQRTRRVALGALVGLTAIGVVLSAAAANGATQDPRRTAPATVKVVKPLRAVHLVGDWRVLKAGEAPGTTLVLGATGTNDLVLLRPCGQLGGEWNASNDGAFVGMTDEGDGHCFKTHHFTVAWLPAVTGASRLGRRIALSDSTGLVVAVLKREPSIPKRMQPNPKHDLPVPEPKVTAQTRKDLANPAPLPNGVVPATPADVLARWNPAGKLATRKGYVFFRSDDNWRGSDGCNGYGGRYLVGSAGQLLELDGPSTAVGCIGSPAPGWVDATARVGVTDTGDLLLFDRHGKAVGTLAPKTGTPNVP